MHNFFHLLSQINIIAVIVVSILFILICVIYRKALTFYIKELIKIYAVEDSFFSKKRIESGIAFAFALGATIYYVSKKIDTMDMWSFGYVMTTWLFIAGYTVNQIQNEKTPAPDAPKP